MGDSTAVYNSSTYRNDIEALVVKQGCALEVFKESDCTGGNYSFYSYIGGGVLVIPKLKDTIAASDFGMYDC